MRGGGCVGAGAVGVGVGVVGAGAGAGGAESGRGGKGRNGGRGGGRGWGNGGGGGARGAAFAWRREGPPSVALTLDGPASSSSERCEGSAAELGSQLEPPERAPACQPAAQRRQPVAEHEEPSVGRRAAVYPPSLPRRATRGCERRTVASKQPLRCLSPLQGAKERRGAVAGRSARRCGGGRGDR